MNAKDLPSSNLVVVPPEMTGTALIEWLATLGISSVPDVDAQGAPVGIVTEVDPVRRLAAHAGSTTAWVGVGIDVATRRRRRRSLLAAASRSGPAKVRMR